VHVNCIQITNYFRQYKLQITLCVSEFNFIAITSQRCYNVQMGAWPMSMRKRYCYKAFDRLTVSQQGHSSICMACHCARSTRHGPVQSCDISSHNGESHTNKLSYRATTCNATHGIAKAFLSVCLSVCQTRALWVTKRKKLVPTSLYHIRSPS